MEETSGKDLSWFFRSMAQSAGLAGAERVVAIFAGSKGDRDRAVPGSAWRALPAAASNSESA